MKNRKSSISSQFKEHGTAGIYVGRFNPMHLGHQAMIKGIVDAFGENHLILIGSCNEGQSIRHLFNYEDRATFIQTVFPHANIAPLPDFEDDATWFRALDDMIRLGKLDPAKAVYVGGSEEDVGFYFKNGRNVHIINRYAGKLTVNISAAEIRDALIGNRKAALKKYLDRRILPMVTDRFAVRWAELRKK
jgi:cytidyltransferase-like protein